jgi:putative Mg2+ transporter-C (MgtC) family protein
VDAISIPQSSLEAVGRLALATVLGAIIGMNRELEGKPAGLRTHSLVSLGAALFTVTALLITGDVSATGRVMQGITAGVGFIGAGVILRRPELQDIRGLTTAAAVWVVSAVGVAVGAGLWRISLAAVVLAFAVLVVGEKIDQRLHH